MSHEGCLSCSLTSWIQSQQQVPSACGRFRGCRAYTQGSVCVYRNTSQSTRQDMNRFT